MNKYGEDRRRDGNSPTTLNPVYGQRLNQIGQRHMSTHVRGYTPTKDKHNFETASSQAYREQEKRNSTIWDAITLKDYERYKKEEDVKKLRRKGEQEDMRMFLDAQVKETQFKKNISQRVDKFAHEELTAQLKRYDKQAGELYRNKRKQLEEQVKENFDLVKRKKDLQSFDKAQSVIIDNNYQSTFQNQAKSLENQQIYNLKKIKEDRQRQLAEELSHQQLLKSSSKVFSKMDHLTHMNDEFNLLMKNQDRHKTKIKQLVDRNDLIYNNIQRSPYKNLAMAEKERERKLQQNANQSFITEVKKRNQLMDEMRKKKQIDYLSLQNTQMQQIQDKIHKKKQKTSIELLNDKIMLQNLKSHEAEMLGKEKSEEENKRQLCKKNLDEQKAANMSIDPSTSYQYVKEFELNKSLLKDISPDHSII